MSDQRLLDNVRIDIWLWAVRLAKTRTDAAALCERGKVEIQGQRVKPGRKVRAGDEIVLHRDTIEWRYVVRGCIEKRVGASLVSHYCENRTPQEAIDRLKQIRAMPVPRRDKGAGRPTKKDRRAIDRLQGWDS